MNRLQKKCFIATAGFHLLLVVILLVGPAFFSAKPKVDNLQVLDVLPANLIDAQFNSGVKGAQSPAPTPIVTPPLQSQPPPPAPKPVAPAPTLVQKLESVFKSEPVKTPDKISPDELKPVEKVSKTEPHKIEVNLKPVVHIVPKNVADNSQNEAREQQRQRNKELQEAMRALKNNLSKETTIDMPGNSSVAYANYTQIVKSIYYQAWTPPDGLANADENVKVHIVIASDGTVISARIIESSGDPKLDASIQRVLDRVTFIAPFPDDSKDKERPYNINFNLKTKQLLG